MTASTNPAPRIRTTRAPDSPRSGRPPRPAWPHGC
jgi:hypothetical protein